MATSNNQHPLPEFPAGTFFPGGRSPEFPMGTVIVPVNSVWSHMNSLSGPIKHLEARGYRVIVAAPPKMQAAAEGYGFHYERAGSDWSEDRETLRRIADARFGVDGNPGSNDAFNELLFGEVLPEQAAAMAADIQRIAQRYGTPEFLLHDVSIPGLLGDLLGVQAIPVDNGLGPLIGELHPIMREKLNEIRASLGLPPEAVNKPSDWRPLVTPMDPGLFFGGRDDIQGVQPAIGTPKRQGLPPGYEPANPEWKNVYVMLGSTGWKSEEVRFRDGIREANILALKRLSQMNVNVIASVGPGNEEFYRQYAGENTELVGYTDQPACLEWADVFVGHGGFGGVRELIKTETPTLFLPQFGDQQSNADRVANELGMGHVLDPHSSDSPAEREQKFDAMIDDLLTHGDRFKEAIHTFNEGLANLPTWDDIIDDFGGPAQAPGGSTPTGPGSDGPGSDVPESDGPRRSGPIVIQGWVEDSWQARDDGESDGSGGGDSTDADGPRAIGAGAESSDTAASGSSEVGTDSTDADGSAEAESSDTGSNEVGIDSTEADSSDTGSGFEADTAAGVKGGDRSGTESSDTEGSGATDSEASASEETAAGETEAPIETAEGSPVEAPEGPAEAEVEQPATPEKQPVEAEEEPEPVNEPVEPEATPAEPEEFEEEPTEEPAKPESDPADRPAEPEAAAEKPEATPVEEPAAPEEKPEATPEDKPVEEPAAPEEKPEATPEDKPVEEPAEPEAPEAAPAEEPAEAEGTPEEEPVEQPAEAPEEQPADRPVELDGPELEPKLPLEPADQPVADDPADDLRRAFGKVEDDTLVPTDEAIALIWWESEGEPAEEPAAPEAPEVEPKLPFQPPAAPESTPEGEPADPPAAPEGRPDEEPTDEPAEQPVAPEEQPVAPPEEDEEENGPFGFAF